MAGNLLQEITSQLGGSFSSQLAETIGEDPAKTTSAIGASVPAILGGLLKKVQSPAGSEALNNAVNEFDGTLLDNLGGMLSGNFQDVVQKGLDLLRSLLGGDFVGKIVDLVSGASGISKTSSGSLLGAILPVIMSVLGREKNQRGLDPVGLLANEAPQIQAAIPAAAGQFIDVTDALSQKAGNAADVVAQAAAETGYTARAAGNTGASMVNKVVLLIIVAALAYFGYRAFTGTKTVPGSEEGSAGLEAPGTDGPETGATGIVPDLEINADGQTLEAITDIAGSVDQALANVTDVESAEAARDELRTATADLENLSDEIEALPQAAQAMMRKSIDELVVPLRNAAESAMESEEIAAILKEPFAEFVERFEALGG